MVAVREYQKTQNTAKNLTNNPKDRRFLKTEKAIFDTLGTLLLENPMTVSIHPTELARRSKIAASTFYRHFPTIDDAIKYRERNMMRRFHFVMKGLRDSHSSLHQCIERVILFIYSNQRFFDVCFAQGNRKTLGLIFEDLKPKIYHSCHLPKNSERMLKICFNEIYTLIDEWRQETFDEKRIKSLVNEILYLLETIKKRLIRFIE